MTDTPRYQNLEIWKRSFQLTIVVYKFTKDYPEAEKFGLVSQIRRCSVSIPSNIAEGAMRSSKKDFAHFLNIALSSAAELQTQILLSKELSFIKTEQASLIDQELLEIMKMISVFRKKIIT